MANLDELRKKIYRPGEVFSERLQEPSLERTQKLEAPMWKIGGPIKRPPHTKKMLYWLLGGGLVAVLAGVFIFVILAPSVFFETQAVDVSIQGPGEIQSGERISWTVEIVNRNRTAVDGVAVVFNFPAGAASVSDASTVLTRERREIGSLAPGQKIVQTFDAAVFGGRDQKRSVSSLIEYRPSGSSATFAKTANFAFIIARSPIALSLDMPKDLRVGQKVSIQVRYVSQSAQTISGQGIVVTFPEGFDIAKTIPDFEKNKNKQQAFWRLHDIAPSATGGITVEGTIRGSDLDSKSFHAEIGTIDQKDNTVDHIFDEVTMATTLHAPFLEVVMDVPSSVTPGKQVTVTVRWRNNLPVEVRDPVLEITPTGDAIDIFSLRPNQGSFKDSYMIWNASTYAPFHIVAPGGTGSMTFSFTTKSNVARGPEASRPVVKLNAVFRATSPIAGFEGVDVNGSNVAEIKISTKLSFTARGAYFGSPIPNTGPLPPKIGQETTYAIIWSFANMANDVNNVVVRAALPAYMKFKNVLSPSNADIRYDESSGFVIWKVGKVPAGTGFVGPALQGAFQVGLTPLPIHEGDSPNLVTSNEATATDSFTNELFDIKAGAVTIELRDDPGMTRDKMTVVR